MTTLPEEVKNAVAKALRESRWLVPAPAVELILTAALPFLPVQGAVKKLEWKTERADKMNGVDTERNGFHEFGYYSITGKSSGCFVSTFDNMGRVRHVDPRGFGSIDDAKAAAQADYEARILSALEPSAARELALEEALSETRTDLVILQGNVADAAKTDSRWEGMYERVGSWIKRIDDALSSPDHSSDARNMVQDHIADAGKLAGADRPSVKGTIPTAFGDSVCFSGIDHSALILVSVRGNSGLVPIKYLLPHQLYVHDVQKLSEQGEVLVCAVPVYDQQINVTSALPSAPASEGAE